MVPTPKQQLDNIETALIDSIMEMTPEDVMAEAVEEMGSIDAVEIEVERMTRVIRDAFPANQ